jgi:hypothetical protein
MNQGYMTDMNNGGSDVSFGAPIQGNVQTHGSNRKCRMQSLFRGKELALVRNPPSAMKRVHNAPMPKSMPKVNNLPN